MKFNIEKKIALAFIILEMIFVVLGIITYQTTRNVINNYHWVSHTEKVLAELNDTVITITDAETGQRGFVLSGKDEYLEPYISAASEIDAHLEKLRQLTPDNPNQQQRLVLLETLISEELKNLKQIISTRREGGLESAIQLVSTGESKQVMDDIRKLITEMKAEEMQLLEIRETEAKTSIRRTEIVLSVLALLIFGLTPVGFYFIKRDFTRRRRAKQALRAIEERFQAFMDYNPAIAFMKDEDGRFVYINQSFENASNLTKSEVIGKTDIELWSKDYARQVRENDTEILAINKPMETLENVPMPDGSTQYWLSYKFPVADMYAGRTFIGGVAINVTAQKQLETALKLNESRMAEAQRIAHLGSWEFDIAQNDVTWTEELYRIFGIEPQEYDGTYEGYLEYIHPDDLELVKNNIEQAMREKKYPDYEHRIIRRDGTMRVIHAQGIVIADENGEPIKMAGTVQDVTERKLAQEALVLESNLMQALMDNIPDAIYFKDAQSRFLRVSKHMHLKGINSPEEAIGKTDFDFFTEEHAQPAYEDEQRILKTGQPIIDKVEKETFLDGTIGWVSTSKVPIFDTEGKVIGIIGASRDITERRQMEETLQENAEQIRLMIESVEDYGIFMLDTEGHVMSWNTGAERIKGYRAEEIIGKHFSSFYTPEDIESGKPKRELEIAVKEGRYEEEDWRIRKDGTRFWANIIIAAVKDSTGRLRGFAKVSRDITERMRVESESKAISEIIQGIATTSNLDELLVIIYQSIKKVLYAENCFIALYDNNTELLNMQFFVDKFDTPPPPFKLGKSQTAYVFRHNRPMLMNREVVARLVDEGEIALNGTPAAVWLGVPLRTPAETIGVLVVQHYEDNLAYSPRDLEFLSSVGDQIALAIERKRVEEALRENEAKFRDLFDNAPVAYHELDTEGRFTRINHTEELLLGYTNEELKGRFPWEIIVEKISREATESKLSGKSQLKPVERTFIRKDGTLVPVLNEDRIIYDQDGNISGIRSTLQDISELKLMEAKLLEQAEHLSAVIKTQNDIATSELDLQKVMNLITERTQILTNAKGAVIELIEGDELVYRAVSGSAASFAGLRLPINGSLSGQCVQTGNTLLCNDSETDWRVNAAACRRVGVCSMLVVPLRKDRKPIGILKVLSSEPDAFGERDVYTLQLMAGVMDAAVSHTSELEARKLVEVELKRARDAALESVRLKSEFLANMSHEIRTPMNGVIGMTGLLLETELDDEQQDYAKTIQSSAESLLTIINDILDFSKIEAGKLHFEKIDFDLCNVVESTIGLLAETAQNKAIELASLVDSDVPTLLRGDAGRLKQVLLNLTSNAVKFTGRGEVIVDVSKEIETETHVTIRFAVKDTGIGISDEQQKRLFQAFVQADGSTTRKYGGTGLGLAISKQIVEMMGGKILIESEPNKGSTFHFTVQLEKQPIDAASVSTTLPRADLQTLRVLIVDDNATNRRILVHQTTSWGMISREAENGQVALESLRAAAQNGEPFDVALLDFNMPEMNGFELARLIKTDSQISATRLILMPSFGNRGDAQTVREIGISGYLMKPVRQSQLFDCISTVMGEIENAASNESRQSNPVTQHSLQENNAASNTLILIAEDNLVNQKVSKRQVEKLGYRTDVVSNGIEALDALAKISYDIVLMDCQMPEMDGFAATTEIRRLEGTDKHTIVIALTANAQEGEMEKCLAAGMDDYLSKPVNVEELKNALERWQPTAENIHTASANQNILVNPSLSPPVDMYRLRDAASDDEELMQELIEIYLEQMSQNLKKLKTAVEVNASDEVKRIAHTMIGSSATCGMIAVVAPLRELEQVEYLEQSKDAKILVAEVEKGFEQTKVFLKDSLTTVSR